MTAVGQLACQQQPYLRQLDTTVLACTPVKNKKQTLYHVELQDTSTTHFDPLTLLVLFPEGGGQPHDLGTIQDVPVLQVVRQGVQALHVCASPLTVGDKVHVEVDWTRRWDHMQQHSGQHLISAYLENNHDLKTLSWSMGTMVSTVDVAVSDAALLNRPEQELLAQWEQDLNELIRQDKRVVTHSYAREQQGEEHSRRGLPKDYTGTVVRVIEIDGVDKNACCGTHINRLGELQVITFPRMDVLKNQTVIRVHFLVGTSRVLSTFHGMVEREKDMTALLDTRPQDHVSKATLVLTAKRELEKDKKRLRQDVAMSIADRLIAQMAARDRVGWYREDFDLDFMTTVIHCCRDKHDISKHVITLAGGALKTGGPVMILGTESELVEQSIIMVKQLGDGVKGGGKGGRWMGKSTQWHSAVNDLLT